MRQDGGHLAEARAHVGGADLLEDHQLLAPRLLLAVWGAWFGFCIQGAGL